MREYNVTLTALDEKALCLKLLTNLHLNVTERRALPDQKARFSIIVGALTTTLKTMGFFPLAYAAGDQIGEGAVIELRGEEIWFHEQHECGVGRYGEVQSHRVDSIEAAAREYIGLYGGSQIDGVKIDFDY